MVTGIVRRVDELGRVVIPKEMRRTLRIREGDELEVKVTEKGEILLKKYSAVKDFADSAQEIALAMKKSVDGEILVTDLERVVVSVGIEYKGKYISSAVEEAIRGRKPVILKNASAVKDGYIAGETVICPICDRGDAMGSVVVIPHGTADGIPGVAVLAGNLIAAGLQ